MKNITRVCCSAVALVMTVGFPPLGPAGARAGETPALPGRLPLRFEENVGQTDEAVRWVARGPGFTLFLTDTDAVFALVEPRAQTELDLAEPVEGRVIRMRMEGASSTSAPTPGSELPGVTNYLLGDDPSRWRTGVRSFDSVCYEGVYDGVDVVYYGSDGAVEYDFVVAPGADPSQIALAFDGAESIEVNEDGALVLRAGAVELRQAPPTIYQPSDEGCELVPSRYVLDGSTVRFELGDYDRALPLVVDPVLSYSTYFGGTGDETPHDVAVDGWGQAYVVGSSYSADLPRLHAPWTFQGVRDAFVTVFGRAGAALIYSTHIGGDLDDYALAVALGPDGAVFLAGITGSADFPTVNPIETDAGNPGQDAFVSKLSPTGTSLVYSTYLGGDGNDWPYGLAVDGSGSAVVAGYTTSTNYLVTGSAFQGHFGGDADAFVTRIGASGTILVYSTYLGGSGYDRANGVAVTPGGEAVVVGSTASTDFPVANALHDASRGGGDAFAARLTPSGSALRYSTYLGGAEGDAANDVALDEEGAAVVVGDTESVDFLLHNQVYDDPGDDTVDGFALGLAPDGDALHFSTYLPGRDRDQALGVALDAGGRVYVVGETRSNDFPTVDALMADPDLDGTDAFAVCLSWHGRSVVYSTYLGGGAVDSATAVAVDGSGNAYVVGYTASTNFPTVGPYQANLRGHYDAFVTKIGNATANLQTTLTASPEPVRTGQQLTYTLTVGNLGPNTAGDVIAAISVPSSTSFVSATPTQGTFTPPAGTRIGYFFAGSIQTSLSARLTVVVQVTAPPGATIDNMASVITTALDPVAANNTASFASHVISGAGPPVIESVESLIAAGKPYRIRITGTNFQEGVEVFIGSDASPWPNVKRKGETALILKKGGELKARFPRGVAIPIRVVNPDTGEDTATFAR